jgi:uncharacterized membrane protein
MLPFVVRRALSWWGIITGVITPAAVYSGYRFYDLEVVLLLLLAIIPAALMAAFVQSRVASAFAAAAYLTVYAHLYAPGYFGGIPAAAGVFVLVVCLIWMFRGIGSTVAPIALWPPC